MRALIRVLQAIVIAMLFALPAISDEGGGGDSGVWILPRSLPVGTLPTSGGVTSMSGARATLRLPTLSTNVTMQMPPEMGAPIAVLSEVPGYARLPIQVSGNRVTLPLATLKHVRDSVGGRADGWMADGNGRGFLLRVVRTTGQEVRIEVF